MKTHILALLCLLISYTTIAQYTVTTTMNTYQDLSNPISLNQGAMWTDATTYQIFFNFDFDIYGQNFTALNVYAGGGLHFPGLGNKQLFVVHSPFGGYFLTDKGTSSSQSPIGYEISGTAGNQILKIEWKNAGFPQTVPNPNPADFIDYQIWLFESDNHIEIRFGPNQFNRESFGQSPGTQTLSVKFLYDTCNDMLGLQGSANLPSYSFYNSCVPNYTFIDGSPNAGITYVFNPSVGTAVTKVIEKEIKIYPNPTSSEILIEDLPESFELKHLEVCDITGRILLMNDNFEQNFELISVSLNDLLDGIYFLKLIGKEGTIISKKIIKEGN